MFSVYNRPVMCQFVNSCTNILNGPLLSYELLQAMKTMVNEKLINYHNTYTQLDDHHKVANLVCALDLLLIKIDKKQKLILDMEVNNINNNNGNQVETSLPNYIRPN